MLIDEGSRCLDYKIIRCAEHVVWCEINADYYGRARTRMKAINYVLPLFAIGIMSAGCYVLYGALSEYKVEPIKSPGTAFGFGLILSGFVLGCVNCCVNVVRDKEDKEPRSARPSEEYQPPLPKDGLEVALLIE